MSRILLVDDSPHAQRIGERILSEEGFEVVTVSNADSALIRLDDAEPDVVLAKSDMPGRSGIEICRYVKMSPRHRHVRVILTVGATDLLDEAEVERAGADGSLRKPFEASLLLDKVRPLAEAAERERSARPGGGPAPVAAQAGKPADARLTAPVIAVIDPEQVRAAVTVAVDAVMGQMVDEITNRVLASLTAKRQAEKIETQVVPQLAAPAPLPAVPVRPVTRAASPFGNAPARSFRPRSGSILGLNLSDPELPPPTSEGGETE